VSAAVELYAVGLCFSSVCASRDLRIAEIEKIANARYPTGIESRWQFAEDEPTFSGGQPNPCPCDRHADRLHWLLSC
jgi:hypothetical protein